MTATNDAGYQAPVGIAADPVILTVVDNELKVLLLERADGNYVLPGGFVGAPESPEETAARKLQEKTGMQPGYLEQLRTYGAPERDPRGWILSVAFLALVAADSLPADSDASWQSIDQLPEKISFDHREIIIDAVQRLRGKLWYSNVSMGLLDERFTLSSARKVYEAIADTTYDAANFARDLKNSNLITATEETIAEGRGRPARLYEFVSRQPAWSPQYAKGTSNG